MKFEYNPPSGPSKMVDHDTQDLKQKLRIASNNLLEGETGEDLVDGEFYWKNDDPEVGQRTLYANKKGGELVKLLTISGNKVYYPGINEVDLGDDEEVKGVLPKKKLISASETVKFSAVNTLVVYDGNKFQEVEKDNVVSDIVSEVNEGIDLNNYFNKNTDKINLTTDVEGVLPIENGGLGTNNVYIARENLEVFRYKYNEEDKNLSNAQTGFATYFSGEDTPEYVPSNCHTLTLYHSGNPVKGYAMQYYIGADNFILFGRKRLGTEPGYQCWKKLRNEDGTIPFELGGVLNTYTTSDGQWTETLLSTGEIMLEGWGSVSVEANDVYFIETPKAVVANIKKLFITAREMSFSAQELQNRVNAGWLSKFFIINTLSSNLKNVLWNIKAILA